jgi:hypothetical protein
MPIYYYKLTIRAISEDGGQDQVNEAPCTSFSEGAHSSLVSDLTRHRVEYNTRDAPLIEVTVGRLVVRCHYHYRLIIYVVQRPVLL